MVPCAVFASRWRHNGRDGFSNHQPHDCLLNRLFRRRSKKTPKLRVTGLCVGNSPGTGEFPVQMASNAENVSISWRHHMLIIVKDVSAAPEQWYGSVIVEASLKAMARIKQKQTSPKHNKNANRLQISLHNGACRPHSPCPGTLPWSQVPAIDSFKDRVPRDEICEWHHIFEWNAALDLRINQQDAWWRHQMETFSALLALCAGSSPVTGEFPSQRPVTRSFDVSLICALNKRLSK